MKLQMIFSPDIVFTDLIMPMVSGEQLCRILRNTKKHEGVFIVVLSAIFLEDRERILREVQCDVCIAKGDLQSIRQHVQEALQTYKLRKTKGFWQRPKVCACSKVVETFWNDKRTS